MELIVHIGVSGSESSNLHESLITLNKELRAKHVTNWGYSLEKAPIKEYKWQNLVSNWNDFYSKGNKEIFINEMRNCLIDNIKRERRQDTKKIVWSNGRIIDLPDLFLPALKGVQDLVSLKIICYLDHPSQWANFAYKQWGIKHKTYSGKIKTFDEYFLKNKINHVKKIVPFLKACKGQVEIYNTLAMKESSSSHFLGLLNVQPSKKVVTSEISNEELYLRFLFNNEINDEVLPSIFDRHCFMEPSSKIINYEEFIKKYLSKENTSFDVDEINTLLENFGQKTFKQVQAKVINRPLDKDRLISFLLQMVVARGKATRLEK